LFVCLDCENQFSKYRIAVLEFIVNQQASSSILGKRY